MKYVTLALAILLASCDNPDPYAEGMHWDYSIHCYDGFLWRHMDSPRGMIPVLHSDGKQMRCGEKHH